MADIYPHGGNWEQSHIPPHLHEHPEHTHEPNDEHHHAHHPHGFKVFPYNILMRRMPTQVEVILPFSEISASTQRNTNYYDNASENQSADNVLICRFDNKIFVDFMNDAVAELFRQAGKLCKLTKQNPTTHDIEYIVPIWRNYDENFLESLAITMQNFIVCHITFAWLRMRNAQGAQTAQYNLNDCADRLRTLVNWREYNERRRIDPIL